MGSVLRRYPNLNRGLVLLVTLLLPPATAAAVLHALSQEPTALVAPSIIEARVSAGATVRVAEEETDDDATEPAAIACASIHDALPTAPLDARPTDKPAPRERACLASAVARAHGPPRAPPA